MDHIEYFKLQAKNLLKDYKTRYFNTEEGFYEYRPIFFDIANVFLDLELNDDESDFSFTLMNAQHVIAQLAGFSNWSVLLKATSAELELAHLLFDNAHKISLEEWEWYIADAERMNNTEFNNEIKLDIFKQVFLSWDKHRSDYTPYRFDLVEKWKSTPDDSTINEDINFQNMYIELNEQEKMATIKDHQKNGLGFSLEETVECLHCGDHYKYRDVKAIRMSSQYRSDDDFDRIVCKNFPKCNGSIIDLIPLEKRNKKMEYINTSDGALMTDALFEKLGFKQTELYFEGSKGYKYEMIRKIGRGHHSFDERISVKRVGESQYLIRHEFLGSTSPFCSKFGAGSAGCHATINSFDEFCDYLYSRQSVIVRDFS